MPTIKLFDGTELIVSQEQLSKIDVMIEAGVDFIEVNKTRFRPKAIAIIKPQGQPQIPRERRIAAPEPERKPVDINSPGYKTFQAARKKLIKKVKVQ